MACCPSHPEEGYATPAALVLALALALISIALVQRSAAELKLSRADLNRLEAEYALAGAHLEAAAAVVRTGQWPPYHWSVAGEDGVIEARAEPERKKLGLAAAARLDDRVFAAFAVEAPEALRAALVAAAKRNEVLDVGGLDPSPLWRACASAMISSFGTAESAVALTPHMPTSGPGPQPQSWRIGELWRIQVTTSAGWRDERIVRFTGDSRHPAATVLRRLSRDHGGRRCDSIWSVVSGG